MMSYRNGNHHFIKHLGCTGYQINMAISNRIKGSRVNNASFRHRLIL